MPPQPPTDPGTDGADLGRDGPEGSGEPRLEGQSGPEVAATGELLARQHERQVLDPCQEAITTLYGFLDGELTPDMRRRIQHHLEDCSPCLSKFDFEAELKAVIARKCRDDVPESLKLRVAQALHAEEIRS